MITVHYDILAVGVAAVDDRLYVAAYPAANSKAPILRTARAPGGLATTAAATAARLGGHAAYVARLGNDELSNYMTATLGAFHVDISHIIPDADAAPFHSTIIVDNAGNRTILYDSSRYRQVSDLPDSLLRAAKLIFLDYLQDPAPMDLARKIRAMSNPPIPILADIEGRSDAALAMLPFIDHLIVSEDFARWATRTDDLAAACKTLAQSPRAATIVTAGDQGCYLITPPLIAPLHVPAFPITAVDTTGCGDTFHGAFALAIARHFTPHQAAIFANAAAALKASHTGGWEALPTAPALLNFLQQRLGPPPLTADQALLAKVASLAG
ncbi:MAG: PfkB family carbohydrate kinase [Phycisphaerales bacterium]|nr:PfkB family carbohydrate kinase [Phycisphaerales bacterium]